MLIHVCTYTEHIYTLLLSFAPADNNNAKLSLQTVLSFITYRIDTNFRIKISDFGLSEDVYRKNYFRQGDCGEVVRLPVKWMAPESLSDGHFSEKSDVVNK